jgi:hypothetical protein
MGINEKVNLLQTVGILKSEFKFPKFCRLGIRDSDQRFAGWKKYLDRIAAGMSNVVQRRNSMVLPGGSISFAQRIRLTARDR